MYFKQLKILTLKNISSLLTWSDKLPKELLINKQSSPQIFELSIRIFGVIQSIVKILILLDGNIFSAYALTIIIKILKCFVTSIIFNIVNIFL